jgi:hypothetical protein
MAPIVEQRGSRPPARLRTFNRVACWVAPTQDNASHIETPQPPLQASGWRLWTALRARAATNGAGKAGCSTFRAARRWAKSDA